jgi:hypothetical protein
VQPDIRGLAQQQGLFETIMRAHASRLMRSRSIQHWVLDEQRPAWRLTAPGAWLSEDYATDWLFNPKFMT